jgi:cell division protein FtsX
MQPENKQSLSAAHMVNYKNPRTIGQIQDELRAQDEAREDNGEAHQPY